MQIRSDQVQENSDMDMACVRNDYNSIILGARAFPFAWSIDFNKSK